MSSVLQSVEVEQHPYSMKAPRFLLPFDVSAIERIRTDVLVVGSGVAGLRAAIEAHECGVKAVIVTKSRVTESNSYYAQGGIAGAVGKEDSIESHIKDTLRTGCGLSEENIVRLVVSEGIERIYETMRWGMKYDLHNGQVALGREGGHTANRILHAGDETGKWLEKTLIRRVRDTGIKIIENAFLVDLIVEGKQCRGAIFMDQSGQLFAVVAGATVLATGGAGQIFRETTNPPIATGDGIAAAYRAGAVLRDMEFIQFHPTALYIAGAPRTLISEAVRGAGAVIRDRSGGAFMKEYDPMGDLAPRDVVSLAILKQMVKTGDTQVYLDLRPIGSRSKIRRSFPHLSRLCKMYGLNIEKDLIPVRPAAHYTIGGIATDEHGGTSSQSLFAAGECASHGLHGANRLASNSLLECLVFGKRAGHRAASDSRNYKLKNPTTSYSGRQARPIGFDLQDVSNSLKSTMWRNVGPERSRESLEDALSRIIFWGNYIFKHSIPDRGLLELVNMNILSYTVASSALGRKESRGCHYRSDYPHLSNKLLIHTLICR